MNLLKGLTLFCAVALLSGCCSCRKPSGRYMASLSGTHWVLIQQDGRLVDAGDRFYITFDAEAGTISGKGSCNRISGPYTSPAYGKIQIGSLASTRMMCPDHALENSFFKTLGSTDRYEIDGTLLMLFTGEQLNAIFEEKKE